MNVYLAPMQGITDWIFREAYSKHIGTFHKTFSPYIRIENGSYNRVNQKKDILLQHNEYQTPIPQFLGNDAASFFLFEEECAKLGYTECNINLGCPFVKVAKHRLGAGLLSEPATIESLLREIFTHTKLRISIKCRLGLEHEQEFEQLLPIFNNYPIQEIIIHARTGIMLYAGEPLTDAYLHYAEKIVHPVCYNGNISSKEQVDFIRNNSANTHAIMVGRGIVENPFLLHELNNTEITNEEKAELLVQFHNEIVELCSEKYSGDNSILKRLLEMWQHHHTIYQDGRKILKAIKKCRTLHNYSQIITHASQQLI